MVADQDNPLTLEILSASSTAYSYYPDDKISEVCIKFELNFIQWYKFNSIIYVHKFWQFSMYIL